MTGVFKRNILEPIPLDAKISDRDGSRSAIVMVNGRSVRRKVVRTAKGDRAIVGESPKYFGKIKLGPKSWRTVMLFSDKLASERRLQELQREQDQWVAGVRTETADQALRPIALHVDEYLTSLRLTCSSAAHHAIASSMLRRLVAATGWQFMRDMTVESIERALPELADTESYMNGFIKRAKAFGSWLEAQGRVAIHPLRRVRRVSEKNATRTRARRAATPNDSAALFALSLPDDRRLSYALAALNGLRRGEIGKLTWDKLHLTATIPFVKLAQKNGVSGKLDSIPLHPYVVKLLNQRTAGMPGVRVVGAVPDVKTLERDWKRAGVCFVDEATKERVDFHALRHTFETNLDLGGCSRATKKRLMRHAAEDVTDGYAHAELAEMIQALRRLPQPDEISSTIQKTGTDDQPVLRIGPDGHGGAHHRAHHGSGVERVSVGSIDEIDLGRHDAGKTMSMKRIDRKNQGSDAIRVPSGITDENESTQPVVSKDFTAGYPSGLRG